MGTVLTLSELNGHFLKFHTEEATWEEVNPDDTLKTVSGTREIFTEVPDLSLADGVCFLCPVCFVKNKGIAHSIICWFTGRVPDDVHPKPGRWNPSGSGMNDLTFVGPGATSVQLTSGCQAHFHIEQGIAKLC